MLRAIPERGPLASLETVAIYVFGHVVVCGPATSSISIAKGSCEAWLFSGALEKMSLIFFCLCLSSAARMALSSQSGCRTRSTGFLICLNKTKGEGMRSNQKKEKGRGGGGGGGGAGEGGGGGAWPMLRERPWWQHVSSYRC